MKDKLAVDWIEVAKTNDATPEIKVEGLKEKMVYQFRIRAHNKAGPSEPSDPTDNHLCKHRNCKLSFPDLILNSCIESKLRTILQSSKPITFISFKIKLHVKT